ncbi:hypothetical protein [Daejeonella oryzae]|uniref:hypothetical protein n=1 Tax=Daejeonella oryzae TaxID=1122943 RepID=UPI00040F8812|nr:hypothetical protein [Daejeonella oryzae]
MNQFDILFFFDSLHKSVFEVRRHGTEEISDLSKSFYWLLLDKNTKTIHRLDFVSLSKFPNYEKREFNQGTLKFNSTSAHYIPYDTLIQLDLESLQPYEVTDTVRQVIANYFNEIDRQGI